MYFNSQIQKHETKINAFSVYKIKTDNSAFKMSRI